MTTELPLILEEIDMNAEIGAYQNEDDRNNQEPILTDEPE
jgi:hypothetical protein